jgi:DNA (cytosine-5)-methyltransferase 1
VKASKKNASRPLESVELFAGAGGLALGISDAGFHHRAVIERDRWACDTIRYNQERGVSPVVNWPTPYQGDVREFDYSPFEESIDLVSGGPPCQPFSIGGKHRGYRDDRDMFPEAVRAVREIRPRAFLFENVRGLLRPNFAEYFEYILLRLTYPELVRRASDKWTDHLARLDRHHTAGTSRGLSYNVTFRALNAADHGVPQSRVRVVLVGFRADLGIEWSFPGQDHTLDSLLWDQWVSGEYWDEHSVSSGKRPPIPTRFVSRVAKLKSVGEKPSTARWRTVRDVLQDLPEPKERQETKGVLNHWLNPGARSYTGHTGSIFDLPAKTLKAGVHGVPGGENMLAHADGSVRYFTAREAARLQTFPDNYAIEGAWSEAMRQLGNAVPVKLSQTVAVRIRELLSTCEERVYFHVSHHEH